MAKSYLLVIDDDETMCLLVKSVLQKEGFETASAENGVEGLNIIKTAPPQGIILDWNMPEMNGLDVLKQLKSDDKTKSIPVMMLTSKNDVIDISASLEAGAYDYIIKPFDYQIFTMRIKRMLA